VPCKERQQWEGARARILTGNGIKEKGREGKGRSARLSGEGKQGDTYWVGWKGRKAKKRRVKKGSVKGKEGGDGGGGGGARGCKLREPQTFAMHLEG
jgi:hypothetical protein